MGIVHLICLVVLVQGLPTAPKPAVAMQTECVAISINVNDYWCLTMCPTGQCPQDMCKCGTAPSPSPDIQAQANVNNTNFAVRDLTQDVGGVPLVIVGEDGACKSLSDSASDEWCTSTCKGNLANCPTMCDCSMDNKEQVDVDPIQVNNGDMTSPTPGAKMKDARECKSLSPAATDEWCAHSCGNGDCPETMCQCGDKPKDSPAGTPAVPVAAAPAPVAASAPAQSPTPTAPMAEPATDAVSVPATSPAPPATPVAEPVVAAPSSVTEATAPAIDTSKCVAVSPAATQEWCVLTCGTGSCPETLCDCNGSASLSPTTADAVAVPVG